ncbi:hypothetical protein HanPI659440_Chr11g0404871 [Helianthus annuus]|nr:hypothetical protein HanPI659440_Chr11g0404871 [Helianthus annuus]
MEPLLTRLGTRILLDLLDPDHYVFAFFHVRGEMWNHLAMTILLKDPNNLPPRFLEATLRNFQPIGPVVPYWLMMMCLNTVETKTPH